MAKLVQDLDKDFTCSICMERYINPRMLPCVHSYCLRCLKQVERNLRGQLFTCPTCRRIVDLPDTGVKGLPHNFFLVNIMERLELQDNLSKLSSSACTFCRKISNVQFCLNCKLHVCTKCQKIHNQIASTDDHVMISTERLSDEKYMKKVLAAQAPSCDKHQQEKLRFYCTPCSILVCRDCMLLSHQGHKCVEAETKFDDIKNKLGVLLQSSTVQVKSNAKVLNEIDKITNEVEQEMMDVTNKIEKHFDEYVNKLQSEKDKLMNKLKKQEGKKCDKMKQTLEDGTNWMKAMGDTQQMTRHILQGNNVWEILGMEKELTGAFGELNEDGEVLRNTKYEIQEETKMTVNFKNSNIRASYTPGISAVNYLGTLEVVEKNSPILKRASDKPFFESNKRYRRIANCI